MRQIFNIFGGKGSSPVLGAEIAVSLALLMMYSCGTTQRGWSGHRMVGFTGLAGSIDYRFLAGLTTVLLPMAWAFLIVRAVQAEALVGDRQFWVTRPYEWKKLLAAKMLFVVLTINAPLLIADVLLLARAGFNPAHYIAGLLWMQLLISLALILPILTLSDGYRQRCSVDFGDLGYRAAYDRRAGVAGIGDTQFGLFRSRRFPGTHSVDRRLGVRRILAIRSA